MKIQKLEQLRELIKEGWELKYNEYDWGYEPKDPYAQWILESNKYKLKSPSGEIIPVEYCEGDLDEHSFKEGDKVRCKPGFKNDDNDTDGGGFGYKEGCIVTIQSLRGGHNKKGVIADFDNEFGIWTWALELVTEETFNNKEKEDEVHGQNQQQRGSRPKGNRAIREKIKVTSGRRPTGSRVSNRRRREQPRQTPISGRQLRFD